MRGLLGALPGLFQIGVGFVVGCALLSAPPTLRAQEEDDSLTTKARWGPPHRMLSFGLRTTLDNAQSSRMLSARWYDSNRLAIGLSGQMWDDINLVEGDLQWFLTDSTRVRPYIGLSSIFQDRGGMTGIGGSGSIGGEIYIYEQFSIGLALGWRSLFQEHRESEFSQDEATDDHWFRVIGAFTYFPRRLSD